MENRVKQHKFSGKKDAIRANRREVAVQLRKDAREDQMTKRRNLAGDLNKSPMKEKSPMRDIPKSTKPNYTLDKIEKILKSGKEEDEEHAILSLRKLLSANENPPIDTVIKRGLVPIIIRKMTNSEKSSVQFEASWALTNIASGTTKQTAACVKHNAIPALIALFDSHHDETVEQAIWALGNIAGDGHECRDLVLKQGVVAKLMKHINSEKSQDFLRNLTWMISNLCRNKPTPPLEYLQPLLAPLAALVNWHDTRVQADACWALSYITDGTSDHVQAVCDTPNLVAKMIDLIASRDKVMIVPALRAVGNIITGDDHQTQFALEQNFMAVIPDLLASRHANVVKEACWALSNITAGTNAQVNYVIESGTVPTVVEVLFKSDFKTQKEAAYVIANMASAGVQAVIEYLVGNKAIDAMGSLLKVSDTSIVILVLEFFGQILKASELFGRSDEYSLMMEEANVVMTIEELQNHENQEVYEKSLKMIEGYFTDFEDETGQGTTTEGFLEFRTPLAEQNTPFSF